MHNALLISAFFLAGSLALAYGVVIFNYLQGWNKTVEWRIPDAFSPKIFISVIIAARNEGKNIENCLVSVLSQNFPSEHYEVILVDDHSEDVTAEVAKAVGRAYPNLTIISLSDFDDLGTGHAFKKKAIEKGILAARGELIVTTDADCVAQRDWLMMLASFYEYNQIKFIAAPVLFYKEKNWLERFQSLDFIAMMGVTGGGIKSGMHRMCNGANLCYEKKAYLDVGGFSGIDRLASGDDMLLMHKIASRWPQSVGFLKNDEAVVNTIPMADLGSLFNQRIRWASKTNYYNERNLILIPALVYGISLAIVTSLVLIPFFEVWAIALFAILFVTKSSVDYLFLRTLTRHFHREDLMKYFLPFQLIHVLYFLTTGTLGLFVKKYSWKGRVVK